MLTPYWCKVLKADGRSTFKNHPYALPKQREDGAWEPGEWMPARQPHLSSSGWHLTREPYDYITSLTDVVWEAEHRGDACYDKYTWNGAFAEVRLLQPVPRPDWWVECLQRLEEIKPLQDASEAGRELWEKPRTLRSSKLRQVIHVGDGKDAYDHAHKAIEQIAGTDPVPILNQTIRLIDGKFQGMAFAPDSHIGAAFNRIWDATNTPGLPLQMRRDLSLWVTLPMFRDRLTPYQIKHVEARYEAMRAGYLVYAECRGVLVIVKVRGKR